MNLKLSKNLIWAALIVFVVLVGLGGSYTWWNTANPDKTCARCHEIHPSHQSWAGSAHSNISCFKCHGTALENGWHSFSEKAQMVFTHIKSAPRFDEIRMSEIQLIETMDRCIICHQTEYSNWLAGGHSINYAAVLLDEKHNTTEQLNSDCLRCHGMFYPGTTQDLVEPISRKGPWKMKDEKMANKPSILCMTCHKIHSQGEPVQNPDYSNPDSIFYNRNLQNNSISFYIRNDKMHLGLSNLPTPIIFAGSDPVQTPTDPVYRLCVQCHAPSVRHQAGSSDDKTPTGVHEGLSCRACHEPHSNYQRNSCDKCHPAISNCNLDVKTMNTTFYSPTSKNDIHFVSCTDCHDNNLSVRLK